MLKLKCFGLIQLNLATFLLICLLNNNLASGNPTEDSARGLKDKDPPSDIYTQAISSFFGGLAKLGDLIDEDAEDESILEMRNSYYSTIPKPKKGRRKKSDDAEDSDEQEDADSPVGRQDYEHSDHGEYVHREKYKKYQKYVPSRDHGYGPGHPELSNNHWGQNYGQDGDGYDPKIEHASNSQLQAMQAHLQSKPYTISFQRIDFRSWWSLIRSIIIQIFCIFNVKHVGCIRNHDNGFFDGDPFFYQGNKKSS